MKRALEGQAIEKSVAESNVWGADLHISIHTNAGVRGCIVFVYKLNAEHYKYATPVYNAIAAVTTANETYGVRKAEFYEILHTTSLCIYVECEFHDNVTDAKGIIGSVNALGFHHVSIASIAG